LFTQGDFAMRVGRAAILVVGALLAGCGGGGGGGGGNGGGLPAGLPRHFAFGLGNGPADLAWMTGSGAAWDYRYQYLSGGVNTGSGWSTWNAPPGDFALLYMNQSAGAGIIPVLVYYQIVQSTPNAGNENPDSKLQDAATMNAYFADWKLLMQKAGAFGKPVVVIVEPDFWGFCQQNHGDDPSVVAVRVAASGFADAAGFPDTLPGFAQCLVTIRDDNAPKAILAFHASHWGAGADLIRNHADPVAHADKTAGFFNALGAPYDLLSHDPSDRDAGYKQYVGGDGGASWWVDADFDRYRTYLGRMWQDTGRRGMLWQVPVGNTVMKTGGNIWGHYQDNRAEYFLLDTNRPHAVDYAAAGVIAVLFGATEDGTTHYTDYEGDGVTNGGTAGQAATLPDDDGGFLRTAGAAYYTAGPVPLPF
jgi:hypothetical protein